MAKRRGRGEGSIEELKNPTRFRVTLSFGVDPATGKRRKASKTFRTKKDALDWRDRQRRDGYGAAGTLGDWLTSWLELHKAHAAPQNYRADRQTVEKHVRPALGAVKLAKLSPLDCRRFLAGLKATGVSPNECHKAGRVLRKLLNAAADADVLPRSPMARVKLPPKPQTERRSLTDAEVTALFDAAKTRGGRLWELLRVGLDSGLRPAELLGLQWQDWDGHALHVRRAVDEATGELKDLKTARSRRTIPLSAGAAAALAKVREDAEAAKAAEPTDPIFVACSGRKRGRKHQRPGNFAFREWKPLAELAGVECTPYAMRHTMASLALRAGASLKAVSDRLGHADPAMTLRVYAHLLPGDQERVAGIMGGVLDRPGSVPSTTSEQAQTEPK